MKMHEIGGFMVRNYLLVSNQGIIAIDTGYPGGLERFMRRFSQIAPLSSLRYLFLTHAHDDHAGFLGDLLEKTNAQVILHPLAKETLYQGKNQEPPGAGYSSRLAATFGLIKKDFSFPQLSPALLEERAVYVSAPNDQPFQEIGLPLWILFLPGHTADSIGLLDEETGFLYCGDAAMNAIISPKKHTIWIDDAKRFGKSWDEMLAAKPTKILPAHGNPFSPAQLRRHRNYLCGRRLLPMR